jgi:tetratricopeptide (TPR) repeat protein
MGPKETPKQPVPVPTQLEKQSLNAADKAPPQPIVKATPPTAPVVPAPSTDSDATKAVTTPDPAKRENAMDTASPAPKPEPKPAPTKTVNPEALQWAQKSYESVLKGDAGEAIVAATVALTLEPELVNAYINRSWAYSQKGRYDKAIADCNKALEIDPDNALAYNNRGLAFQEKGDVNSAKADYDKACRLGFDAACRNFREVAGR